MWSQLFLCALVGFASASQHGWLNNMEYEYKVQGRTFTALHDVSNQYSGIVMKAKLLVRPEQESLMGKIVDAKYSQIHTYLPEGWRSDIPESKLHYKQLEISEKPFEIIMKNGIVKDVIVSREVHNWEANIIKSIVSQVQLDLQGEHLIKAQINQLPEDDSVSAVYKTMEDTITGTFETLYEINELPEYILQSEPELVPMPELKRDGEIIEIVKSKNFSHGEERLSYYYGLGGMGDFEPSTTHMGEFFLRSGVSRVILSGDLKRYTIQSATSTNKVILSPTLNSEEKGMVVSHLNLTLSNVKQVSGAFEKPHETQRLGSLTYTFNTPFSTNHEARQGPKHEQRQYMYSSEERQHYRSRRSIQQASSESVESSEEWAQEEAKLHEAPHSPLLPLTIGYKGKNIKKSDKVDIVKVAQKLAKEIGQEIQHPQELPKEQTLAKYVILSSVLRIMDQQEMEQVARIVYTKETEGVQAHAWYAYRDAVAECGTGPALLTIQKWIQSRKIESEEAAEIIATMADSVRQPTEEYMQTFYHLVKDEQIKSQAILNDTAILSYCTLARKVYVDELVAHNQYPVHAFGKFQTKKGQEFVAQELIPYLKEKLDRAVEQADAHKVLVYIRCLGNVAHPEILSVFEQYLEGDKQVSQFQRLQMVVALDKLVKVAPKVARSVLYKIYQNVGELPEIRVAAVFQLMRTCPPASMLQRMAQYTNIDVSEQVNAAVQSAIQIAAELESDECSELSENARVAEPLLTKNVYGVDYSQNWLRDYVAEEMNFYYKQNIQTYGSQDSLFHKGIKYALRTELNGLRTELFNVQYMISSIDELTNVVERQTEQFEKHQKQHERNFQQTKQNQWSSEAIAQMLNIKTEEREQLEGTFLFQMLGGVTRFFTFNNQTVELLPSVLREVESLLREGQDFEYSKFMNRYEIAISFPTEMALPLIYTLDAPTLLHIQGKVRATAEPEISNGEAIRRPNVITAHSEIRTVVSTRIQSKLGFVTPFDHQEYVAGFDKNIQAYVPLKSQIEINLKQKQMTAQFQPIEAEKDIELLHFSTWPYTSQYDILALEPVAQHPHTKILYAEEEPATEYEHVFGEQTGMAFRAEYTSEQKFFDLKWLYEQYQRHDAISLLFAPFYDETLQHNKLSVKYAAKESTARKVIVRMGFETEYYPEYTEQEPIHLSKLAHLPRESQARQQEFVKMAAKAIHTGDVYVCDASVEFDGHNKVEYTATAALARDQVDANSRIIFFAKKYTSEHRESKPFEIAFTAKAHIPNTNGLDFKYALEFDPTTTAQAEFAFGENLESATKFNIHAKLEKSQTRKQYLKDLPRAEECRQEMKQGNQALPACANMTAEANLLDRVYVHIEAEHMTPRAHNITHKLYNAIRYLGYFNLDENTVNPHTSQKENEVEFIARFEPDFESVNVTLRTHKMESHLDNIRVDSWAKQVIAVHPVFPVTTRVMSEALALDTYRPICVVDKTEVNTFDNKTYPAQIGNSWTVMMQYVPEFARESKHEQSYQQQQKELQLEQYVVLVRDAKSQEEKEVKMTLRTPSTNGELIEVELKPVQGECSDNVQCAQVFVNGKQIKYDDKKSTDIEHGLVQVYGLPNGEVKVEVRRSFYIIYDGERVKLTAIHDKFQGAIRGLCGTFTGEEVDDFLTPKNCILEDAQEFVESYALDQTRAHQRKSHEQSPCYYQEVIYANVISDRDAGRSHQEHHRHSGNKHHSSTHSSESCTKHQTRYEVQHRDNEICFTVRPLPVCQHSCRATNMIEKNVQVHCVQRSNVSEMWREQIHKGASPDFSHKSVTKTIKMEVPESCSK